MNERIAKVLEGLDAGKITSHEADAYLRAACGTTLAVIRPTAPSASPPKTKQSHHFTLIAIILVVVGVAALMYSGNPTGLSVLDIPQENATTAAYPIPQVAGLNITGVLYGDGNATVYFDTAQGTLLVARIESDDGSPRTDKPSYAVGEMVHVIHPPENASYYFDDGNSTAIDPPFPAASGELLIVTADSTYRLPIIIGEATRALAFAELCVETCALNQTNGTLRIETEGDSFLELTSVQGITPNAAPQGTLGQIQVDGITSIDLNQHFTDADGDDLYYDVGSSDLVNSSIQGSTLTFTPVQAGTGSIVVYVSDLQELVPVTVGITVLSADGAANDTAADETGNTTDPVDGSSQNTTPPIEETPVMVNITPAANATPTNATLDCSGGNPNELPEECLLLSPDTYFPEQDIFWENAARQRVARFTVIGNLLLTGDIIERSTGNPAPEDFSLGYVDPDFNTITTIWVDTSTGDLHLRGNLVEESANLSPPAGSYTVTTRRKVHLAYVDLEAGNLHLRGNAIPYRRSI